MVITSCPRFDFQQLFLLCFSLFMMFENACDLIICVCMYVRVCVKDLRKLMTFQMKCLRAVSRWDQIRNDSILESATEVPIADQLRHARFRQFGHVTHMDTRRIQHQLLCSKLKGKLRPKGGTPLRWIDIVNRDLRALPDWASVVLDRSGVL